MHKLRRVLFNTQASYAITLLRITTGLTFAAHGAQKLFGWFGGYGLEGTGQWMASIGLEPGVLMALLAGSAEFFGGLLLVIGLLVRPAALSLVVAMLIALFWVHLGNCFFMASNGFECAMTLAVISVVLLLEGAGRLSVDAHLQG